MMTLPKSQGVGTLTVHCRVSMCMDLNGHPSSFLDAHLNRVSKSCDDKSCYEEASVFVRYGIDDTIQCHGHVYVCFNVKF